MKLLTISIPGYTNIAAPGNIPDPANVSADKLIQSGITLLLTAAVLLTLVYILWGAIQWIMSEGDKQKIQNARNKLTYSIIGLIVALLAFAIVSILGAIFQAPFIPPSPSGTQTKGPF